VGTLLLSYQALLLDTLEALHLLQWWWEGGCWIPFTWICHNWQWNSRVDCRVQVDGPNWVLCVCLALWKVWLCRLVSSICIVVVSLSMVHVVWCSDILRSCVVKTKKKQTNCEL